MNTLRKTINNLALEEFLVELIDHDVRAPMANFSYFLAVSKEKTLTSKVDDIDMMPLLESFFHSSAVLLEAFANWKRITHQYITQEFTNFHADVIIQEILSSVSHQLTDKKVLIDNRIPAKTICYGNQAVYTFVLKNLMMTCLSYGAEHPQIKITFCEAINGAFISVTGVNVCVPQEVLEFTYDIHQHRKLSGKDAGLLLSKHILEYYGGRLNVMKDDNNTIFTFYFSSERG